MPSLSVGGGLSGAASGAAIGTSIVPGVGTAIGAGLGGLLGLFSGRNKRKKVSSLDKRQQKLYKDYANGLQGQGPMANLFNFDPAAARQNFQQMYAQPAYQSFQENVVPGITGQFRGGNLQNSSYLGGALANAGRDVQRNLDAQLANILYNGQQASVDRRINGINNLLNTQTFAYENQSNPIDSIFGAINEQGGKAAGNQFADWLKSFRQEGGPTNQLPNNSLPIPATS